ncbi:hypothetical protein BSR29_06635 [Boudabousia liubingyangii]|uniref:Glycosyltransferase n=1 Tax=Boudabousia liubingyangii TaxID=1921764 RepID=A0A1Q5PKX7_9ACTO|nr:hypothetical protein BSR29_06635 [Boudabousia liubingyangii]
MIWVAEKSVHAVLVTQGESQYLAETLDLLKSQTRTAELVTLVDLSETANAEEEFRKLFPTGSSGKYLSAPSITDFGTAVSKAVNEAPIETDWLWLLHDDSIPDSQCLAELLAATKKGATVGVVGPKIRDYFQTDKLIEIGISATKTARRFDHLRGEYDQGQHDRMEDVLAVSTAGMLVSQALWTELRGTDPSLSPFGVGLEFGRRVRLAGYRVIVATSAIVFHAEQSYRGHEGLLDASATYSERRAAQIHNWLLALGTAKFVLWLFLLPFWQLGRMLLRLATRQWSLAVGELAALFKVLFHPQAILRARANLFRTKKASRASLKRLEVPRWYLLRERYLVRKNRHRNVSQEALEPVAASGLKQRREIASAGALTVVFVTLLLTVLKTYSTAVNSNGAARLFLPEQLSDFWSFAWSGWVPIKMGMAAPADPLLPFLSSIVAPFWLLGLSPNQVLTAFLACWPLLAGIGAYLAAGTFTRAVGLRLFMVFTYLSLPAVWISAAQGRVSVLVLTMALPWFVWGLVRGTNRHRAEVVLGVRGQIAVRNTDYQVRFLAISAFALTFVMLSTPSLLLLAPFFVLLGLALVPKRPWRVMLLPIPAVLFAIPYLVSIYRSSNYRALLGTIDHPVDFKTPSGFRLLLGIPDGARYEAGGLLQMLMNDGHAWLSGLRLLPLAMLMLGLILALLRLTWRTGWITLGMVISASWMAAGYYAGQIEIAAQESNVFTWTGPYLLLAYFSLSAAVIGGLDRYWATFRVKKPNSNLLLTGVQLLKALSYVLLFLIPVSFLANDGWTLASSTVMSRESTVTVPASAKLGQNSDRHSRVLLIKTLTDDQLEVTWQRFAQPTYLEHSTIDDLTQLRRREAGTSENRLPDRINSQLITLLRGHQTPELAQLLTYAAVDQMVIAPDSNPLNDALEGLKGLEKIGPTPAGVAWRVSSAELISADGYTAYRLWTEPEVPQLLKAEVQATSSSDEEKDPNRIGLPANAVTADGETKTPGVIVLAENPDPHWQLSINGKQTKQLPKVQANVFETSETGSYALTWQQPSLRIWTYAGIISELLLLSMMIFTRRKKVDL